MLPTRGRPWLLATVAVGALALACSASVDGYPIASAYCNACGAKAYTELDCAEYANAAGCLSYAVDDASKDGCQNECTFEHCKTEVQCGDPDLDPACKLAEGGLFTNALSLPNACNVVEVTALGGKRYGCACARGCPCGWSCIGGVQNGSTPLCGPVLYE